MDESVATVSFFVVMCILCVVSYYSGVADGQARLAKRRCTAICIRADAKYHESTTTECWCTDNGDKAWRAIGSSE